MTEGCPNNYEMKTGRIRLATALGKSDNLAGFEIDGSGERFFVYLHEMPDCCREIAGKESPPEVRGTPPGLFHAIGRRVGFQVRRVTDGDPVDSSGKPMPRYVMNMTCQTCNGDDPLLTPAWFEERRKANAAAKAASKPSSK